MTTEDDFQTALDASPNDWQTRLVFADWLQDRGDPRAEGYRALGLGRHRTDRWMTDQPFAQGRHFYWPDGTHVPLEPSVRLPDDWWALLPRAAQKRDDGPHLNTLVRRAAEDAAARAFGELPAARRAELLAALAA